MPTETLFERERSALSRLIALVRTRAAGETSLTETFTTATTEAVVIDREGRELMTIPGGSFRGVRLNAEKPADFEAFVAAP